MMFHFICLLVIFGSAIFDGVNAYYAPGGNPGTGECTDRDPACIADAANGLCDAFGEDYKRHVCPKSCGVCSCKDLRPEYECKSYKDHNLCNDPRYHTRIWCQETCGHCAKA